jgi:phytoene dehydrogenase-like protein
MGTPDVHAALGRVGLPAPIAELASRSWDAIVVGGGHNGLAAAAYLARAGKSVLVLERRDRLGGACTLEQPFADERYLVSPCAYVVGLLDPLVIRELDLPGHGYSAIPADPNIWCPFPDGTSFASFLDPDETTAHLRDNGFSSSDIDGYHAYEDLFERARLLLRHGTRDTWRGPSPTRAEIEDILGDHELTSLVFEDSIADVLDRYIDDHRLVDALFGQGIIGAWAGPRDPGTAAVKLMHHQGDLLGRGSVWGYVVGGMGRVSFAIAEAALEAGAVLATGVPVSRIEPGRGVVLESGERISTPRVVSNADPKSTLAMLEAGAIPDGYRARLERWDVRSPVVKLNAALGHLPSFTAAGRESSVSPHRAMITVTRGIDAGQDAFAASAKGECSIGFIELYFQSVYDPSTAPPGKHTMSAFAHYAPFDLADGDWNSRRAEITDLILGEIAAFAPNVHDCVEEIDLLGPPDIERRIGLAGGNIFQGSILPDQMWDRRLSARTPIDGLYLCGAATHPGGSVIALNGRNAAQALLDDLRARKVA